MSLNPISILILVYNKIKLKIYVKCHMTIFFNPFAKGNSKNHQFGDKMSFIQSLLFEHLHYYYIYFHYSYLYNYYN